MNHNLMLVSGKTATGKSVSLRNIKDPEGVWYLNCENNKALPFKSKFREFTITDPLQIYEAFDAAENNPKVHTIIIDTLTYLMDMYESLYVLPKAGTKEGMTAWGQYAQFFKQLMSQYVAKSTKNIIFLGHTMNVTTEDGAIINKEVLVKVKGSLMNQGIESFFSTVVSTKKVSIIELEAYKSPLLNITAEEEMLGYKYCFQVKPTKETKDERIRSSLGMWDTKETYIDNDVQLVLDKLGTYYN